MVGGDGGTTGAGTRTSKTLGLGGSALWFNCLPGPLPGIMLPSLLGGHLADYGPTSAFRVCGFPYACLPRAADFFPDRPDSGVE